jgi:hypothetical protein
MDPQDIDALGALPLGRRRSGEPAEGERGHFMLCPYCGQAIDRRDLAQVLRHEAPGHEPDERP